MSSLNNFPFPGFSEFCFAERRGLAELGINPHYALRWALTRAPVKVRLETGGLMLLTLSVVVGAAWYGVSHERWVLFSLPCFTFTFWLAGPFTTALGRKVAPSYFLVLVLFLMPAAVAKYFLFTNSALDILGSIAIFQLIPAGTFSEMYRVAFRYFKAAALADVKCFERFWDADAVQIVRADGKGYSTSGVIDADVGSFPPWRNVARIKRSS